MTKPKPIPGALCLDQPCEMPIKARGYCSKHYHRRKHLGEFTTNLWLKHGYAGTSTHHVWKGMRQRCLNANAPAYADYGGRGITICERWMESFENFLADMGEKPEGLTLDRRDNNGPYSPENCAWASRKAQAENRRSNRILEFGGKRQILSQWAADMGEPVTLLAGRLDRGWPVERALTEPRCSLAESLARTHIARRQNSEIRVTL